jgi:acyl carrier protein
MTNELEQRVKNLVAEQLGNEVEISNDSSLVDDLGADSLDAVELSMALEDEFNIELSDEEIKQITTVQSAIDLAKAKQE